MGIEKFSSFILSGGREDSIESELPGSVGTLIFDANGILHTAAQKIYGYSKRTTKEDLERIKSKSKQSLKQDFLDEITNILQAQIKFFSPTENVVIDIDGVAVLAKISQQKYRRYKSVMTKNKYFDSNCITPGTDMMFEIDEHIKDWIKSSREYLSPKRIIYSGHLVPGEGEHKIYEHLKNKEVLPNREITLIFGADADLIMLSLLSRIEKIFLCREKHNEYINIDKLYEIIEGKGISIEDFSIITNLVGNDFLPKPPSFIDPKDMLEKSIDIIIENKLKIVGDDQNINWDEMGSFFQKYLEEEPKYYKKLLDKPKKFPYLEIEEAFDGNLFSSQKMRKLWYAKTDEKINEIDIKEMSLKYLLTFQWILYYYVRGHEKVSSNFFYPFRYAPLTEDLVGICAEMSKKEEKIQAHVLFRDEKEYEITPIHQLLLVMPPASLKLIPEEFHPVYKALDWMHPEKCKIPLEGIDEDWQAKPKIPGVSIEVVSSELKIAQINIDKKYYIQKVIISDKVHKKIYKTKVTKSKEKNVVKEKKPLSFNVNIKKFLM